MSTLTEEQRAAAESELPITVVSAAPGSGKTTVLAARIAWLVRSQVAPEQILALTFTRSACEEIRRRVTAEVGPIADRVRIMTFHGFAWATIQSIDFVHDLFRVATEAEAEVGLRSLYEGPLRRRDAPGLRAMEQAIIDHESQRAITPHAKMVMLVANRIRGAGLLPTWDLLPSIELHRVTFEHVLVDEAQDVTLREEILIRRLATRSTFVVMDRAQAIMGFRGGRGLDWPATHRLSKCFRFGPEIAAHANEIAARMGTEPIEGVGPDGEVIEAPVEAILDAPGTRAVLCRTHRECHLVARQLGSSAVHIERRSDVAMDEEADRIEAVLASGRIAVSTIHAFKGREADAIAVMPFEIQDAEDWRVWYVGVTRGRREMVLVVEAAGRVLPL